MHPVKEIKAFWNAILHVITEHSRAFLQQHWRNSDNKIQHSTASSPILQHSKGILYSPCQKHHKSHSGITLTHLYLHVQSEKNWIKQQALRKPFPELSVSKCCWTFQTHLFYITAQTTTSSWPPSSTLGTGFMQCGSSGFCSIHRLQSCATPCKLTF